MLTPEQRGKIAEKLREKGAVKPCPRCGKENFTVVEGYFFGSMQDNLDSIQIGGYGMPTAAILCDNCGFLMQHSLKILGLP